MLDGTIIAIYQGNRGSRPDLDFIVKHRHPTTRLRTPSHTHWVIDLVIKGEVNPNMTLEFVNELINIYDETQPFETVEERNNYELIHRGNLVDRFNGLNTIGALSIEMLTTLVELFSKCEKRSEGAFMFRNMLDLCKQYLEGKKDYYQLIGISKRV
jgi:hypothetical protein